MQAEELDDLHGILRCVRCECALDWQDNCANTLCLRTGQAADRSVRHSTLDQEAQMLAVGAADDTGAADDDEDADSTWSHAEDASSSEEDRVSKMCVDSTTVTRYRPGQKIVPGTYVNANGTERHGLKGTVGAIVKMNPSRQSELDKCIAKYKTHANDVAGDQSAWALEQLCRALLIRGGVSLGSNFPNGKSRCDGNPFKYGRSVRKMCDAAGFTSIDDFVVANSDIAEAAAAQIAKERAKTCKTPLLKLIGDEMCAFNAFANALIKDKEWVLTLTQTQLDDDDDDDPILDLEDAQRMC